MSATEICFWVFAAAVVYHYLIYPVVLALAARLWGHRPRLEGPEPRSFSVVVAAHNEAHSIAQRVRELAAHVAASGRQGEIILVCDGCTDATAHLARSLEAERVRVIELATKQGKAAALNHGCTAATGEIVVFADVRQTWDAEAIPRLLANFADPEVGAVTGNLLIQSQPGVLAGVGLYWRFEKWLRRQESQCYSLVNVTGAISAVRRFLFPGIPKGTLLDDMYWPLRVIQQGYRVVYEERALAYDRLPDEARGEFRRKLRTQCGSFQLAALMPTVLMPWRNPVWFQFISHKFMRLIVPWLLVGILTLSAVLPGRIYSGLFWAQIMFYLMALLGLWLGNRARSRIATTAASFLLLNTAAWVAFWIWIGGQAQNSWSKVHYQPASLR
jgi:biofilm PGA synthesis N-glycosyltransferase PgaC